MKKQFLVIALASLFALPCATAATPDKSMAKVIEKGLSQSAAHALAMYDVVKNKEGKCFPCSLDKEGNLKLITSHGWESGFFPGSLWYLWEHTGNDALRLAAEDMTERITPEQFNTESHDVGFIVNCSFGNGYRLTGKEAYRTALINGAKSLATRFNPEVGCTRSWNRQMEGGDFVVIIDNMMNLELLCVGAGLDGNKECYDVAVKHATTTMKNHYREDGSSFHVVVYDSASGDIVKKFTYQGLSDDSAWSRGQAWGLYGFTYMYRTTGNRDFLEHATKIGKYILNHPGMPKDYVPYWDFMAPATKDTPRDASAAALMASAFVELSGYVEDEATSEAFLDLAEKMIRSLSSSKYFAKPGTNGNFVLKHSTAFLAKNRDVDAPLSYADYYYIEALARYKNLLEGKPAVEVRTLYSENEDRAIWLSAMEHIARPFLTNLAAGTLKKNMPVESNNVNIATRHAVTHLEGLGRLIEGIAPWLELGPDATPEGQLRAQFIDLAVKGIANAVNPESPDYLNFNNGRQPLVDAAFLAHGLLRAPTQLWGNLDDVTKERLAKELKSSRVIKPSETNWLFFSAMVEAALYEFTGEWEFERVKYAFDRHKEWYKGDGWYGDGKDFHLDYYNSFVIQPMMVQVLDVMAKHNIEGADFLDVEKLRYARYAEQQERLISPEGTFPAVGRSLAYRFGAFQALSDVALRHWLPEAVNPAQVRCGLTAVIDRVINAPGTFTEDGWLRVGFCGYQPSIGERYISTGSVYLCSAVFLALGLPETDPFWSAPDADWTAKKVWSGVDVPVDKAIKK